MTLAATWLPVKVGWRDLFEVALVAFVLYHALRRLRGARAFAVAAGLAALAAAYAAAMALELALVAWTLDLVLKGGLVLVLVIFQPELRAALAHLGQPKSARPAPSLEEGEVVEAVTDAVERLSRSSTGAIIAIERDVPLNDFVESGRELHATISSDLLATIFTPYTPLHDGAVVVRGDSIVGAGCILPLSQTRVDDRSLGTRHRAALGLSEETDALVIVVSEESGSISLASRGELRRGLTPMQLRELLLGRTPRGVPGPAALSA
ncbi:diadenylate cyclase CdaA [Roseisolibacter sp. H3M3-2]|uniref:diadenylate cyclase CdaA n=1 Tax=Roseisolibacter sp. H3M3-2 TaxID=3031323 RepID=UPI0023DAA388|nr:diadenylate cyclase CdaA [Roseisolibacter sp. H3M3-2]MDF1505592.1 diadenylate cyclase CdaA [Roseisolibacter sp. H3M3-2]